jgi:O-antigen/teichoic acid export membrane protein
MKSTKKNLYYNTLLSISQVLYPLITFPYASRVLGPDGIGLFGFVDSITQYFILIAAFGIPIYGIREIAKASDNLKQQSRVYSDLLIIHLCFTGVALVIYIATFLSVPKLHQNESMFWVGSGILLLNVFPTEWFFQGIQNFVFVARRTIVIRLCSIVALFIFVRTKGDVVNYYLINLVAFLLNSVVNMYYAGKFVRFSFSRLTLKRHFSPLFYIFSCNVAISIYLLVDSILLGFLVNTEAVGYYTTATRLSKALILIVTAFSLVMVPKLSALFKQRDEAEINRLLHLSFEYVFFLTVPIGIGIFVVAEDFIRLYAGSEFYPAVMTLRILSPLALLIGLSNLFAMQILTPKGKEKKMLIGVSAGMVFSITLNLILIPVWHQNGAAVSNIITEVVVTVITGYYALKEVTIRVQWGSFFKALGTALVFFPIHMLVMQYNFGYVIKLLLIILSCSSIYCLIQYFVWKSLILVQVVESIKNKIYHARI